LSLRRPILLIICTVAVVGALLLATSDVHAEHENCGSAILPRDTSSIGLDTGNIARDEFSVEEVAADCGHLILRQRYLLGLLVVVAIAAGVASGRVDREPPQFPGDPVV